MDTTTPPGHRVWDPSMGLPNTQALTESTLRLILHLGIPKSFIEEALEVALKDEIIRSLRDKHVLTLKPVLEEIRTYKQTLDRMEEEGL